MFLKGGRPPPPLQTHPHTHTMHEKRWYNGALRILAVFRGRASQPASQGGGEGGGFQSLPATQPRLGAAPQYVVVSKLFKQWRPTHKYAPFVNHPISLNYCYEVSCFIPK